MTAFAFVVWLLPLPIWMSLAAWLWHDFSLYGDWSYLQFNWLQNLSFQIPFAVVVGFWTVMWFNQTRLEKRRSTHPVSVTFGSDHMCFQSEYSKVWWKLSEFIEVQTSPTSAKFLTVGMVDAVELTPSGFESLADYEQFRVLLVAIECRNKRSVGCQPAMTYSQAGSLRHDKHR